MNVVRIMRGKTRFLYVIFSVFMLTFLLNVMLLRVNIKESLQPAEDWHEINKEEAYDNYIARGRRKPKAAEDNEYHPKEYLQDVVIPNDLSVGIGKTQGQDITFHINSAKNSQQTMLQDILKANKVLDHGQNGEKLKSVENQDYDEDEDEDYEEEEETSVEKSENKKQNKIFEPGDFVNVSKIIFARPLLKYQEVPTTNQQAADNEQYIRRQFKNIDGHLVTENGIYWSDIAESLVPKGMNEEETFTFVKNSQNSNVKEIHPPSWNKCGRPKNAYVVLDNGSSFCGRYRDPHNKLVLGEVMSFYLSRLLGMDSVPAVFLAVTNQTSGHWKNVDISSVEWKDRKIVALIQWLPYMETMKSLVTIPKFLLKSYTSRSVINNKLLQYSNLNMNEVGDLVQWSSMVVFDYLTGHYDRFASMQDGAKQENRSGVLSEKVRNLLKSTRNNKLWFIDNESGLLDAYDLLYNTVGSNFIQYHKDMLRTLCVFQRSMVEAVTRLHLSKNPHLVLEGFAARHEPLIEYFSKDYVYSIFKEKFKDRLSEVYNWIQHCKLKSL